VDAIDWAHVESWSVQLLLRFNNLSQSRVKEPRGRLDLAPRHYRLTFWASRRTRYTILSPAHVMTPREARFTSPLTLLMVSCLGKEGGGGVFSLCMKKTLLELRSDSRSQCSVISVFTVDYPILSVSALCEWSDVTSFLNLRAYGDHDPEMDKREHLRHLQRKRGPTLY